MRTVVASAILFSILAGCSKNRVGVITHDDTTAERKWGGVFVSSQVIPGSLKPKSFVRLEFGSHRAVRFVVDDDNFDLFWVVEAKEVSGSDSKKEIQCESVSILKRIEGLKKDENKKTYVLTRGNQTVPDLSAELLSKVQDFRENSIAFGSHLPEPLKECGEEIITISREVGLDSQIHLKLKSKATVLDYTQSRHFN